MMFRISQGEGGGVKGKGDPTLSLAPVAEGLGELLGAGVVLSPEVAGFQSMRLAH